MLWRDISAVAERFMLFEHIVNIWFLIYWKISLFDFLHDWLSSLIWNTDDGDVSFEICNPVLGLSNYL